MRRPLTWLAALGLALSLSACGGGETTTQNQGEPTPTGEPAEQPVEDPTD